jgi:hypothetical protein
MPPVAVADSENRPLRFKIMPAGTIVEFKDHLSPAHRDCPAEQQ